MDAFTTISFVAAIVSVTIGVVAIWQAFALYKLSSASADQAKDTFRRIESSADRLEKIFDRLYSDTFSMMKETVTDMRRQLWPEPGEADAEATAEKRADERIEEIKTEVTRQLADVLEQRTTSPDRLQDLKAEVSEIVSRAIGESRKAEAEARELTVRDSVLGKIRELQKGGMFVKISDIAATLPWAREVLLREIERLQDEKILKVFAQGRNERKFVRLNDVDSSLRRGETTAPADLRSPGQ